MLLQLASFMSVNDKKKTENEKFFLSRTGLGTYIYIEWKINKAKK